MDKILATESSVSPVKTFFDTYRYMTPDDDITSSFDTNL